MASFPIAIPQNDPLSPEILTVPGSKDDGAPASYPLPFPAAPVTIKDPPSRRSLAKLTKRRGGGGDSSLTSIYQDTSYLYSPPPPSSSPKTSLDEKNNSKPRTWRDYLPHTPFTRGSNPTSETDPPTPKLQRPPITGGGGHLTNGNKDFNIPSFNPRPGTFGGWTPPTSHPHTPAVVVTSSPPLPSSADYHDRATSGMIIGVILGGVIGLSLLAMIILHWMRKLKRKRAAERRVKEHGQQDERRGGGGSGGQEVESGNGGVSTPDDVHLRPGTTKDESQTPTGPPPPYRSVISLAPTYTSQTQPHHRLLSDQQTYLTRKQKEPLPSLPTSNFTVENPNPMTPTSATPHPVMTKHEIHDALEKTSLNEWQRKRFWRMYDARVGKEKAKEKGGKEWPGWSVCER